MITKTRKILISCFVLLFLLLAIAGWLWGNRPQLVDMTAYVPAESLVYVEANNLPQIVNGITDTDAWKSLSPPAGISPNFSRIKWLSWLASWTGLGPAEFVVLSRAQLAGSVLSLDSTESGDTLKVKPRAALVIETHTGERRVRYAIEKLVGDFARRAYGAPRLERRETDGEFSIQWIDPTNSRRIIAAVHGSVAVIGNDLSAVEACLAVRRGQQASLAGNVALEQMRQQVSARDALAFGYLTPAGAARILEVAAVAYAARLSPDSRTQSAAAILLPQLANKILGGSAWSARARRGLIEDHYFLALQGAVTRRLREAINSPETEALPATVTSLLPITTYRLTYYNLRNPETAWRGLNAALSSQLDALSAPFVSRFLEQSLRPLGIEAPVDFLRAAGPVLMTGSLDNDTGNTLLLSGIRDRDTLRQLVRRRLGPNARSKRVGDAVLLISSSRERGAASFVDDLLLLGTEDDLRRCLEARAANRTLSTIDNSKLAVALRQETTSPNAISYIADQGAARAFITSVAALMPGHKRLETSGEAFERALANRPLFAMSYMRLVEDGFERKTISSFGQFGALMVLIVEGM